MRKQFLSTLLLLVVFLSSFICFNAYSAKAISDFSVKLQPRLVSTIAEYEFHFKLSKKVLVHDWFHITFPPGTDFCPPLPGEGRDRNIRLKQIMVSFVMDSKSCAESQGMPFVTFLEDGSMQIRLSSPVELNPFVDNYQETVIQIKKSAGIMNPPCPGEVTFSFRTQHEETFISQPVEILGISKLYVGVNPPIIGSVAEYDFIVNLEKSLKPHDWIKIKFPPGTSFDPPIPEKESERKQRLRDILDAVSFPDCTCGDIIMGLPIITRENDSSIVMLFNTPIEINTGLDSYDRTEILISKEAGIVNPTIAGFYRFYMATKSEATFFESQPVELIDPSKFNMEVYPQLTSHIADYGFHLKPKTE